MMRDDIEFNIRFCEEVEQFPCLYDHSRADYCNRSAQDQAWQKIAQTLDCQAADCKERWKNIRGRYTKYKKQTKLPSGSGVKKIKQYYLAEHLNFLDSFLKSRQSKGNVVTEVKAAQEEDKEEESGDEKVNEDNFEERGDAQSSTQGENDPTNLPQGDDTANTPLPAPNPENKKDCGYRKRARPSSLSDVNSSAQKYFETKKRLLEQKTQSTFEKDSQPDPDMAFLQSLLPDMKAMDAMQKRKFKIGVIQQADEALQNMEVTPRNSSAPSTSSFTTFSYASPSMDGYVSPSPDQEPHHISQQFNEEGNFNMQNYLNFIPKKSV